MRQKNTDGPGQAAAIAVMGVSGCGKTVIGKQLAAEIGALFVEGDEFHSRENVALMAAGKPLDDEHRWGWLDAIGKRLAELTGEGRSAVVACSALKRKYRERLDAACPGILFVYLEIDKETARKRVAGRQGHFMPASLVDSQFATLEPPGEDEKAVTIDGTPPIVEVVNLAVAAVKKAGIEVAG